MFFYTGASCDTTANTVSITITDGGKNDDSGATVSVYSGVGFVDTANAASGQTSTTSTSQNLSVTVGAADNVVVDTVSYDSPGETISATGDNQGGERTASGGLDPGSAVIRVGASDNVSTASGTLNMEWTSGTSGGWSIIGVPLVAAVPDITKP